MEIPITTPADFSVVAWLKAPGKDLALVRVRGESVSAPMGPVALQALRSEKNLVCFRPRELGKGLRGRTRSAPGHSKVIDATFLARIVLPSQSSYELEAIAAHFRIRPDFSDAPGRARTAAHVWVNLIRKLGELPMAVLAEMARLLHPTAHPLRGVIEKAAAQAVKKGFGTRARTLRDLLPPPLPSLSRPARSKPKDPPVLLDMESVCGVFSPDGVLAERFSAYEFRPEQIRMAREVCEALNRGLVLMVEAGTGTGKSLAYLIPSILWSVKNEDPVIVSTYTKNLQAQLFEKDLPFLRKALGGAFRYALIKGRANYLCVRRLLMLLGNADRELSDADRAAILPILTWLPQTTTGDLAENAGFAQGMESDLWARISTRPDECVGPRCRYARLCFVRRVRRLALEADVVVANHATVFSEANLQSAVLPDYRCVVFDEAHNLESVATDCLSIAVAGWQIPRVMNRLFRGRRDGAGHGLFTTLRFQLARTSGVVSPGVMKRVGDLIETCIRSFTGIRDTAEILFSSVALLFANAGPQVDRIRYDADHRPENWPAVAQAIGLFARRVGALADHLETIRKELSGSAADSERRDLPAGLAELVAEISAQERQIRTIPGSLEIVLKAEDETFVYWVQRERDRDRVNASLRAAPLDISEVMESTIYSKVRSVVFTSATLTAAGRFDFMRDRLGAHGAVSERLHTVDLGTSFDFDDQVLLAVPTFLPEPRAAAADFVGPFCRLVSETLEVTHGRGLVLFTSHAMLRKAHPLIASALSAHGIRVLAQGIDGDRARLMKRFAEDTSSVLLGTQSFWEGVDVRGESLSCLILAKLPFRPHTDPIVSARCELMESRDRNAFAEFMVPDAALRLKQGFGRLIRTRQDRGVVLVCDPRIVTKGYGRAFRESLPAAAKVFTEQGPMLKAVREFLGG